jgi:hypothetical protein
MPLEFLGALRFLAQLSFPMGHAAPSSRPLTYFKAIIAGIV